VASTVRFGAAQGHLLDAGYTHARSCAIACVDFLGTAAVCHPALATPVSETLLHVAGLPRFDSRARLHATAWISVHAPLKDLDLAAEYPVDILRTEADARHHPLPTGTALRFLAVVSRRIHAAAAAAGSSGVPGRVRMRGRGRGRGGRGHDMSDELDDGDLDDSEGDGGDRNDAAGANRGSRVGMFAVGSGSGSRYDSRGGSGSRTALTGEFRGVSKLTRYLWDAQADTSIPHGLSCGRVSRTCKLDVLRVVPIAVLLRESWARESTGVVLDVASACLDEIDPQVRMIAAFTVPLIARASVGEGRTDHIRPTAVEDNSLAHSLMTKVESSPNLGDSMGVIPRSKSLVPFFFFFS
jgi:hypothetical protein